MVGSAFLAPPCRAGDCGYIIGISSRSRLDTFRLGGRTRYGLTLVSAACFRAAISATLRFASAIFLASSGSRFDAGAAGAAGTLGRGGSELVGGGGRVGTGATGAGAIPGAPPPAAAFIAASLAWISARLAAMSMAALDAGSPPAGAGRAGKPSSSGVGLKDGCAGCL